MEEIAGRRRGALATVAATLALGLGAVGALAGGAFASGESVSPAASPAAVGAETTLVQATTPGDAGAATGAECPEDRGGGAGGRAAPSGTGDAGGTATTAL